MKERILETALRLFSTYGIKSITMQDIARECGISKKTVYEHFSDKTDLVDAVVAFMTGTHCHKLEECTSSGRDAIEELVLSLRQIELQVKSINPVLLFELEKYHPSAWKVIQEFKDRFVRKSIRENLERGIREGLFRSNMNIDIITHLRLMQIESAYNPRYFPAAQFDLHEVMVQVTLHYIHGVATPEGHRRIEAYTAIRQTA